MHFGDRKFQIHSRKEHIYFMLGEELAKCKDFILFSLCSIPFLCFKKQWKSSNVKVVVLTLRIFPLNKKMLETFKHEEGGRERLFQAHIYC